MPKYTLLDLGLQITRLAHFSVTLANQRNIPPFGLIKNVPVQIQGTSFSVDFIIIRLPKLASGFRLLIGWPWLRQVKAVHDWG